MKNYLLIFLSICVFNNLSAQLFGGQIKSHADLTSKYPVGSVFCSSGPTVIVEVTNPTTGKTWMDRNLGATQVATSSTDAAAYGDLYQWGRRSDGHQCRTSATTTTLSSIDQPTHGNFILAPITPFDWRSPQNTNLWQGVSGVNNPCPVGYRIPSETELNNERLSWSSNDALGAINSNLKLTLSGYRDLNNGSLINEAAHGTYWSSTIGSQFSKNLYLLVNSAYIDNNGRALGYSVRCIKN